MRIRVTKKPTFKLGGSSPLNAKTSRSMGAVPREQANLEAEGGENVVGDVNGDGFIENMNIVGPKHSKSGPPKGVPLNLPNGNFIYSNDKSLKISDAETLEYFGVSGKKAITPADIAKRFQLNDFMVKLKDKNSSAIEKRTAQAMVDNNTKKLAELAMVQEGMKNFENGIPAIASSILGAGENQEQPEQGSQMQAKYGGSLNHYKTGKETKPPVKKQTAPIKPTGYWDAAGKYWSGTFAQEGTPESNYAKKVDEQSRGAVSEDIDKIFGGNGLRIGERAGTTLSLLNKFINTPITGRYEGVGDSLVELSGASETGRVAGNLIDPLIAKGAYKVGEKIVTKSTPHIWNQLVKLKGIGPLLEKTATATVKGTKAVYKGAKTIAPVAIPLGAASNAYFKDNETEPVIPTLPDYVTSNDEQLSVGNAKLPIAQKPVIKYVKNGSEKGNTKKASAPVNARTASTSRQEFLLGGEYVEGGTTPPFKKEDVIKEGNISENGVTRNVVRLKDNTTYIKMNGSWELANLKGTNEEVAKYFDPNSAYSQKDSEMYEAASEKGYAVTNANADFNNFGRQSKNENGFYTSGKNQLDMNDFAVRQKALIDKEYAGGFDKWMKDVKEPATSKVATESFQNIYDQYSITTTGKPYFTGAGAGAKDGKFGQYTWSAPSLVKEDATKADGKVLGNSLGIAGSVSDVEETDSSLANQGREFSDSWTKQDLNNFVTAASADIAKVRPTLNQVPVTQMQTTLTDPSRQIAARQEQYNKLADFFGNSADGQTARANMLAAMGESAEGVSNDIAQSNAQNAGLSNNAEQVNTQLMSQGINTNAQLKKTFDDESAMFLQNLTNAKNRKAQSVTAAFNKGVTNEQMYNKWLPTMFPQYRADAWSGEIGYTGNGDDVTAAQGMYDVDYAGQQDAQNKALYGQYEKDVASYGEAFAKSNLEHNRKQSSSRSRGGNNSQAAMMQLLQQMNSNKE